MSRKYVENNTCCRCVGVDLLKAIYAAMNRLDATDAVINKCKYNEWAEIELFQNGNAIDWHYNVSVEQEERNARNYNRYADIMFNEYR